MLKWLYSLILSLLALFSGPKNVTLPPTVSSPTPSPTVSAKYSYPISNFDQRITAKSFGQYITAADSRKFPCGAPFVGYHTGDDLETIPDEANTAVPVYSIADGRIISVGQVAGYGGLIVASYTLGTEPVTAYYGHINLTKAMVKANESVRVGQQLAVLGQGCSTQTDGERKHLHFALHKGTAIDYRGYVSSKEELSAWLDPAAELRSLVVQ